MTTTTKTIDDNDSGASDDDDDDDDHDKHRYVASTLRVSCRYGAGTVTLTTTTASPG